MNHVTLTPKPRPAFDAWLRLHDKDYAWAARNLDRSREFIRLICLPFCDDKRRRPSSRLVEDIVRLTAGGVRPEDWHPPVSEILKERAA